MATNVYANGMEVSGKATPHNVMASMPDVCLSPPTPPAGPIPIPYPNFAQASDTSDGSKTVQIAGKEVNLKGQSKYKKSTGDEAATKTLGMGVISHNITGAVKHKAGSFDVKVEGYNVVRTLDLTTGNHMNPGDGCLAPDAAGVAPPPPDPDCTKLDNQNTKTRSDLQAKSKDKSVVGDPKGSGRGTTVSSMQSTPQAGGSTKIRSAHNNQKARERSQGLSRGGSRAARRGEETPLCSSSTYTHPDPAMQKSGHAEARLFGELGNANPRNITVNIDWRPKTGADSKMPCPDCHKMLCAAADCGHDISLCDSKGQKQNVADHCPADAISYGNLKEAMGEVVAK